MGTIMTRYEAFPGSGEGRMFDSHEEAEEWMARMGLTEYVTSAPSGHPDGEEIDYYVQEGEDIDDYVEGYEPCIIPRWRDSDWNTLSTADYWA